MRVLCRLFHAIKAFRLKQAYFPTHCLIGLGLLEVVRYPEYFNFVALQLRYNLLADLIHL